MKMSRQMGADPLFDFNQHGRGRANQALTGGRGVDVAIEALGTQATFENALRVLDREGRCRVSASIRENFRFRWRLLRPVWGTTRS